MGKLCDRDNLAKLRVMIVDDDADHRWLTDDALKQTDCVSIIQQADCAQEAIAALTGENISDFRDKPDLLFLDIEMPGMDGIALLEQIKSDPDLRDISVIIVSGRIQTSRQIQDALDLGADGVIEKTIDITKMMQDLQESIEQHAQRKINRLRFRRETDNG